MSSSYLVLREKDLVENPTPRVPVVLCLDCSYSMHGTPINELNTGVELFYDTIRNDDVSRWSAEICVVSFGGKHECLIDFASIDRQEVTPYLTADGHTPMGEAVNMALDLLEQRKSEYKNKGVDYYQPWLVLMTDGQPNGDEHELRQAINRTTSLINQRKLTIFPIGIGPDADMDVLRSFSPNRPPLRLKGLNFREFFEWLSKSVKSVSESTPGERVKLDTDGIAGWGYL
jgi:uncharacterized protein YegL